MCEDLMLCKVFSLTQEPVEVSWLLRIVFLEAGFLMQVQEVQVIIKLLAAEELLCMHQ